MFVRKICYGFVSIILVVSIQGCNKTDESKIVDNSSGVQSASVVPVNAEKMQFTSNIFTKDITGNWIAGTGQATVQPLSDGSLKVTDENKNEASGKISGDIVDCKTWNVTGRLSLDKKSLVWSNGFVWKR